MQPTNDQLKQFLYRLKHSGNFKEDDLKQIDRFLFKLNSISTPKKFDIKKYNKILSEVLKWAVIAEKFLKDIIDLWTYHK
jgi:hypothetical protein